MKNPIDVQHLTKSFALLNKASFMEILTNKVERIVILDDLTFSVPPGVLLGVLGRNGAGKSTLLRVLGNVYSSDQGIISIKGNMATIFEMGTFLNQFQTGRQYAKEYLYFMGHGKIETEKIIEEIYEFTELEQFFDVPIHTYSSGMQAKLLFAVATALPSDIFLIDEMLVVGDSYFQGKAWRRLRSMLQDNSSGVVVSHDWSALLKLCEQAMVLEEKKIAYSGPAGRVINRYLGYNDANSEVINIKDEENLRSTTLEAVTGEDFTFEFDIFVKEPPLEGVLGVDLYIERYVVGEGWNRIFNCESEHAVTEPCDLHITTNVPDFPLSPGKYQLAIEIFVPLKPGEIQFSTVYTKMNWLNGDSIPLIVNGENNDKTILTRSLKWKIEKI